jgi:hypothetical protein
MSVDPQARFVVVGRGEAEVIAWRARMHLLAGADSSENRLTIFETENPGRASIRVSSSDKWSGAEDRGA